MTLKFKISIFISILFTVIFGIASTLIMVLFSNFRKQEFKEQLEEKALTTIRLLIDVKEVDKQLLKIIDKNTIHKLHDEKTLVFDSNYKLIYSSLDDTKINWTISDLEFLKKHKTFFKKDSDNEIYGVYYNSHNHNFFALISANDNYGKRKLEFLFYSLIATYLIFTFITWLLSFYVVKQQLLPLVTFHKKISNINEFSLASRLDIPTKSNNEIDLIGHEFNFMMNRIEEAYQKQKEFTAQASHELRTPLARISALIENQRNESADKDKPFLSRILENVTQLNDLIHSLLLLSKIDNPKNTTTQKIRIDEALYNSIEKTYLQYPDFKVALHIAETENLDQFLEISCNQNLLEIALTNLLTNAYLYSDNKQARVDITVVNHKLNVSISNTGQTLSSEEQKKMFQAFTRGFNALKSDGLGLGLRIVHRIFSTYNFNISYQSTNNLNQFILLF